MFRDAAESVTITELVTITGGPRVIEMSQYCIYSVRVSKVSPQVDSVIANIPDRCTGGPASGAIVLWHFGPQCMCSSEATEAFFGWNTRSKMSLCNML